MIIIASAVAPYRQQRGRQMLGGPRLPLADKHPTIEVFSCTVCASTFRPLI
jgi:hypothetical protein